MSLLFAAAVLPALALLVYVYQKDKVEKEPVGIIVRLFFLGVLGGPIAAAVEGILFNVFEAVIPQGVVLLVIEYFVGVAMVEEGVKYLALNTMRTNPEFNYVFDAIVYAVAVSLGFAALENVFYVFDGGMEVAVTRAIFSVPGHCADGVVMGCFYGLARQREVLGNKSGAKTYYLLAFFLPVIEHGFYDAALSSENEMFALVAMAIELAFIVFAFILVNRISKNDSPIMQAYGENGFRAVKNIQQQNVGAQPQSGVQPGAAQWQQPVQGQQWQQSQGQVPQQQWQQSQGQIPQQQQWQQPQGQAPQQQQWQSQSYNPQQQQWQQPQNQASQPPETHGLRK